MNNRLQATGLTILNLIIPGLGSVVGGKRSIGSKQLILTLITGLLLYLGVPGYQMAVAAAAAWLWAFTTSLEFLQGAYDN